MPTTLPPCPLQTTTTEAPIKGYQRPVSVQRRGRDSGEDVPVPPPSSTHGYQGDGPVPPPSYTRRYQGDAPHNELLNIDSDVHQPSPEALKHLRSNRRNSLSLYNSLQRGDLPSDNLNSFSHQEPPSRFNRRSPNHVATAAANENPRFPLQDHNQPIRNQNRRLDARRLEGHHISRQGAQATSNAQNRHQQTGVSKRMLTLALDQMLGGSQAGNNDRTLQFNTQDTRQDRHHNRHGMNGAAAADENSHARYPDIQNDSPLPSFQPEEVVLGGRRSYSGAA